MLGRRKKGSLIRTENDILEEKIRKKEKAYSGGEKEPEKKKYICGFCGEPFDTHQKLSWHIRRKHKGEKPSAERVEEVEELGEEEPVAEESSLEEVIYGFSGQAALLANLKRFELTEAEADAIDLGVELITNAVGMYLNELRSGEEK